jgi:hypothetical protein
MMLGFLLHETTRSSLALSRQKNNGEEERCGPVEGGGQSGAVLPQLHLRRRRRRIEEEAMRRGREGGSERRHQENGAPVRGGSAGVGREASGGSEEGEVGREAGRVLKDTDMWVLRTVVGIWDGA